MSGLLFFVICFLQPICLPCPEVVPYIFGSKFLNPICCFLLGYFGTILGILCMYLLSKHLCGGRKSNAPKEKKMSFYLKYLRKHEIIVTGLLFIIPVVPDEIICVGAGAVGISGKTFFIIAAVSKLVTVSAFAFSAVFADIIGIDKDMIVILELILLFSAAYVIRRNGTREDVLVTR
ncbi:MAG TPA: VTT domain-containing protein [Lachnospiraceae bacterium]|nr:VTT domain-containing protein [Lachnospiraceae bacterium]